MDNFNMELKQLNRQSVEKPSLPIKILQFGEGNFLRAFVDWQVDIANEKGVMNMGVAICKPRPNSRPGVGTIEVLNSQDCLYHTYLEGVKDRKTVKDIRLVRCVQCAINPYEEYAAYEQILLSPELEIIISNTTEAGIRYEEDDDLWATPPRSYPAKVTALLYKRFKHFGGDTSKGLSIICCELIEDNGSTLRDYVLRHAERNGLGTDFTEWVQQSCTFCDTLVDRIVPGFPSDNIEEVKAELGFDDNLVVKAELYHLWVIGGAGYEEVQRRLPLDKAGLHVLFTPSIKQFRDKKVRILNGSHTGMVPIGLQLGCTTVMEAFNNADLEAFINTMVAEEVLPVIEEDQAELQSFAAGILERFYNPHIRHLLKSISLNSLSKWEARNFPTVLDNWQKRGVVAERELFTFAALLTLYSGQVDFYPDDTVEHVEFIRRVWNNDDIEASVRAIVENRNIWSVDFGVVTPFVERVSCHVKNILNDGMAVALRRVL